MNRSIPWRFLSPPPHVEYALTPLGLELGQHLGAPAAPVTHPSFTPTRRAAAFPAIVSATNTTARTAADGGSA